MPSPRPNFFLVNPVARSFAVTDRFNTPRTYSFAPNKKQLHEGIDLKAIGGNSEPVAVLAAQRGVVDRVAFSAQGYGQYIRVVHRWGTHTWVTWYGHLSGVAVQVGQFVLAGQKIGMAGSTGYSSGTHLHLTLQHIGHGLADYVVDDVVDPEPYFRLDTVARFDEASFIADVTVPDGSVMESGQTFEKVWRVRNTGTTTWGSGYRFAFAADHQMGGPKAIAVPGLPIKPGQIADVRVNLTAPGEPGSYRSTWQFIDPDGAAFDYRMYADIQVRPTEKVDQATYVSDVTIEDGSVIQAGERFVKTWRVRNTGTTTWSERYSLAYFADDRMGGPDLVALNRKVRPGEIVDLSVPLVAPQAAGRHRSTWKLKDANGQFFDYYVYADIRVPEAVDNRLSEARYVADVTVPDRSRLVPGETFVKTWRLRNSGATTWDDRFSLAFWGDNRMNGPQSVPLPRAQPGAVVDVSVRLVAPRTPGTHRSTWKGRDPQGRFFNFEVFALIEVVDPDAPPPEINELGYVADMTIPDGMVMRPGETFVKTWRVRNTGTTTWRAGYDLAFFGDEKMHGPDSIALPRIKPGVVSDVSLFLTAPTKPGMHKSTWKGRDPQGHFFDFNVFALIDVVDPDERYDMLPFLRGDGRLYDLEFNWGGGGRQRVQTQVEGNRFFHVKNEEWEELWANENFIFRGTDTSPGKGEVYTLYEGGQYGSAWIPRHMTIGTFFRRTPQVIFRRKSDGGEVRQGIHVTWIQLEEMHHRLKLPSGMVLSDVAVLAAHEDAGTKPANEPFERYYYAKKYGLVAWSGSLGRSTIVREYAAGTQPDNIRETLPWLNR